jgi:hypothetical protein
MAVVGPREVEQHTPLSSALRLLKSELLAAIKAATRQAVRDDCSRALVAIENAKRLLTQQPRGGNTFFAG